MKKTVLILCILLMSGCGQQEVNQNQQPESDNVPQWPSLPSPTPPPLPVELTREQQPLTQQELIKQEEIRIEPTIKDTGNGLKTYQDKQYGFEFQFPKDWQIKPTELVDLSNKVHLAFDSGFSLSIWNDAYSIDELKDVTHGGITTDVKEKKITLDGNPATEVSYTAVADANLGSSQVKKIVFSRNKLIYVIDCSTKVNGNINPTFGDVNTCEKVLPTFKFTEITKK